MQLIADLYTALQNNTQITKQLIKFTQIEEITIITKIEPR